MAQTCARRTARRALSRSALVTCAIIWGWTFVATRICLQYLTPFELLGLRLLLALPTLMGVVLVRRISLRFSRTDMIRLLLGSLIIASHFLIQITGLKYTTATNTGWLIAVSPLAMAALAVLILQERLNRRFIVGIVVATAGILFLVSHGEITVFSWLSSRGDWLVLLSAHTWALYTIVIRNLTRRYDPLAITVAVLLPAGIVIPLTMFFTSDWAGIVAMPIDSWVALLFLGILGAGVAQWFWQFGLSNLGASKSGMYLYIEPLATTALAVPYLGEYFGWTTAAGGALVLAGVYFAEFRNGTRDGDQN